MLVCNLPLRNAIGVREFAPPGRRTARDLRPLAGARRSLTQPLRVLARHQRSGVLHRGVSHAPYCGLQLEVGHRFDPS